MPKSYEELARENERLTMALAASDLALWDYDVRTGAVYLSETWAEMLGRARTPTLTTIAELEALVAHADRDAVRAALRAVLDGARDDYRIDHRVRAADGRYIWIQSYGSAAARDDAGKVVRLIGTNRDITWRAQAEQALRESEERFRRLTEMSSDWYWELDQELRFTRIEGHGLSSVGLRPSDLIGKRSLEVGNYELVGLSVAEFQRLRAERRPYRDVLGRLRMADGSTQYVRVTGEPIFDDAGQFLGYRGVTRNVTDRVLAEQAREESEARFRAAVENSAIGMALQDPDGRWLKVNRALCEVLGYAEEELLARGFGVLADPGDPGADGAALAELRAGGRDTYQTERRSLRKDGSIVWIQLALAVVRDSAGRPAQFIAQVQDITERKDAQRRAEQLALHDALTGLANARLLGDRLEHALAAAKRGQAMVAVLFIDLDGFKPVNDSCGHAVGDQLLQQIAARIEKATREEDTVARPGGDEFVVVASAWAQREEIERLATRLLHEISLPVAAGGHTVSVSASIGISLYPEHGADGRELLHSADEAMYRAKRAGRNAFCFAAA